MLLIADRPGMILDRLGQAWIRYAHFDKHDLICSSEIHPFELRRRAESGRLVHWIDPLAFAIHPNAARVPQVVVVHHLTDLEVSPMLKKLRFADFITTSSQQWRQRLHALTGREPVVIPYSVDASVFVPAAKERAMAALPLTSGKYVIGFSGRAEANAFGRKGTDLFLNVLASARREWDDLAVALIGSGWETLRSSIEQLGIEVAHFRPNRTEDTAAIYPAMDVFLCTSREEGGPCTVLEAMACEVAVVTTNVGHIPEVASDGVNAFVVRDFSSASFMERLRALRADQQKARAIAREGRRFIVAHRDERVAHDGIDFEEIYGAAEANFRQRNQKDISARLFSMAYLRMRYSARRALNVVWGR